MTFNGKVFVKYKRIVVKVGTHSICGEDGTPSKEKIASFGLQIVALMQNGVEVVLVSSGAVGAGARFLLDGAKPKTLSLKQACASVGQPILMTMYRDFFKSHHIEVGQILLTGDVLSCRERFLNARNTFFTLLKKGVLPIVNENDSISVEEIKLGDNDQLAVAVGSIVEADMNFILSDIEGLYENFGTPHQKILSQIKKITPEIESLVVEKKGGFSTGGMASKIMAAKKSLHLGIPLAILPAYKEKVLENYLTGSEILGTTFYGKSKLRGKKKWLSLYGQEAGTIEIDLGAYKALKAGKSLLAVGIILAQGDFKVGDTVGIYFEQQKLGKGLSNYTAHEINRIAKQNSEQIESLLGYQRGEEVIHRDNLSLLIFS